jgi:hypothetical protein
MYELTLAHLTAEERERDLEADLRSRRIMKASDAASHAAKAELANTADAARLPHRGPAFGRIRTAGR